MKLIETKGDVKFYKNENNKLYQQIGDGDIFKCHDGAVTFKPIKQVNGHLIKYDNNGIYGFTIFRGKIALEDRIWSFAEAERIAREM